MKHGVNHQCFVWEHHYRHAHGYSHGHGHHDHDHEFHAYFFQKVLAVLDRFVSLLQARVVPRCLKHTTSAHTMSGLVVDAGVGPRSSLIDGGAGGSVGGSPPSSRGSGSASGRRRTALASPAPLPSGVGSVIRIESPEVAAAVITQLRLHLRSVPRPSSACSGAGATAAGTGAGAGSGAGAGAGAGAVATAASTSAVESGEDPLLDAHHWRRLQQEAIAAVRAVCRRATPGPGFLMH